ncbi:MAG TPA: polyketide synthase dehydratase domain-containing protein, partial [Verrucomicrobiae bacterium]|nr:polyketide synthase dehydratase domain-containing protein [Verrucomicrobiae bacterium]
AALSAGSDPYLDDHVYHGERLFPAVMGLEAMAQVVMALTESDSVPRFEHVKLSRPVVVPRQGSLRLRLAALIREDGDVDVVLRTSETGFQIDHFSARCPWIPAGRGLAALAEDAVAAARPDLQAPPLDLDPRTDLYGDLFFHTGRFQRVLNYRLLRACECLVQLEADADVSWFSQYLPADRVLGDTGVRDAAIHAIQACIPHARLLPVSVGRITVGRLPCLFREVGREGRRPVLLLHASETSRQGDAYHYDLQLLTEKGVVLEAWEDLCLRKVDDLPRRTPWILPLLGPYLERRLEELLPGTNMRVALVQGKDEDRRAASQQVIQSALGEPLPVRYRPDGKPEVSGGWNVSAAHAASLALGVAAPNGEKIGCDLEKVVSRTPMVWHDLLGPARYEFAALMAKEADEPIDQAATRVWAGLECLKKAGGILAAPFTLERKTADGWVAFRAGAMRIASCAVTVRGWTEPFIASFLTV